jgi:glycosyltransferase involved in cell wall biosynthesis
MNHTKVSIIIPVYNALKYCRILFRSISQTKDVDYELVIVDNNSAIPTKLYLLLLLHQKRINRLCFLDRNTFFAGGNNIGATLASSDATHLLLLNSDIEIRDPLWLRKLLEVHERGATAYGYVPEGPWPRADGYCFLIDKDLYLNYRLNEQFQWWWGITKLQSELLRDGFSVKAIDEHDEWVYHFGGKSGKAFRKAKGLQLDEQVVHQWFAGNQIQVIPNLAAGAAVGGDFADTGLAKISG